MPAQEIAAAMQRVEAILQRRPDTGVHPEASATARWEGGTRIVASHANGTQMATEMPTELGGAGNDVNVTPGWLFRAGFASCAATCIAMGAAAQGVELASLEVTASSRSDLRGLLGMKGPDGAPVYAGPRDVELLVRIRAPGVDPERLRAMVEERYRCSPISSAVASAMPVDLRIVVDGD
jgi:organic hydroperoxide reductase OsmC/OhrA